MCIKPVVICISLIGTVINLCLGLSVDQCKHTIKQVYSQTKFISLRFRQVLYGSNAIVVHVTPILKLLFTQVQTTVGPLFYSLSKGWPQRRSSTVALHTCTEYSRTSLLRSVKGLTAKEGFYCCTSHTYRVQQDLSFTVCQRADCKGGVLLLHFTHVQSTVGPLFYGLSKGWPQRRGSTTALHTHTEYSRTSCLRSVEGMTAKEGFYCCTSHMYRLQ